MHFCYRRTIRLKQENFSCNNKTNYTRRHKFITHKNNCCQVFSRSRNDQPLFVNEYKYSRMTVVFAKKQVSGFRRATHKLTSFKQIQTILHDVLRTREPVCRVREWQNSTRSRACKAVFRPSIISYKFLKNLARAPAILADWYDVSILTLGYL